jgi:hypothetical protein
MSKPRAATCRLTGLVIVAAPIIGSAQTPGPQSACRPGLGDLMTMTVQPRHIKLALGGQEKNWTYAAYELHELQDAFDRAARAWPRVRAAVPAFNQRHKMKAADLPPAARRPAIFLDSFKLNTVEVGC